VHELRDYASTGFWSWFATVPPNLIALKELQVGDKVVLAGKFNALRCAICNPQIKGLLQICLIAARDVAHHDKSEIALSHTRFEGIDIDPEIAKHREFRRFSMLHARRRHSPGCKLDRLQLPEGAGV
jgi:hypothetical protein